MSHIDATEDAAARRLTRVSRSGPLFGQALGEGTMRHAAKFTPVAKRKAAGKPRPTKRRRRLRLGRLAAIAAVVVVAYLYYRPLSSWSHAHGALAHRASQVRVLEAQKATLEREVAQATSLPQLARSARRIGLVRPGERLFIVKGILQWRRTHVHAR